MFVHRGIIACLLCGSGCGLHIFAFVASEIDIEMGEWMLFHGLHRWRAFLNVMRWH